MARDPFAEMSPGAASGSGLRNKLNAGRVITGIVLIASATFLFAYYVPLSSAHSTLAKEHETLSASHSGTSTQLEKTTQQLSETQKERDELAAKLGGIENDKQQAEGRTKSIVDKLSAGLSKEIAAKSLSVEREGAVVVVDIDNPQVFEAHEVNASKPGRSLLCALGKALKDVDAHVEVGGHTVGNKVKNPLLRRDHSTVWDLSAARSVGALRVLESCGVAGKRLSAAGYADHQGLRPGNKKSDGMLRVTLRPSGA